MALYEYTCRECETSFELRRAMGDGDRDVACPNGHTAVRRKLSVFASVGAATPSVGAAAPPTRAGGCCGGACGCGH